MGYKIPFLVLGLTGPIGAGCTSMADIILKESPMDFVERNKLYDKIIDSLKDVSSKLKTEKDEIQLEIKQKQLANLYRKRSYLEVIQKLENLSFTHISMSSLIIKLAVQNVETPYFSEWEILNPGIAKRLKDFWNKWSEIIKLFNDNEKKYSELSVDDLERIDIMLKDLTSLRNNITKYELELYFRECIKELYLQVFGDSLRISGNAFLFESKLPEGQPRDEHLSIIAKEANCLIKYYRNRADDKKTNCFIIDAFRNPAEVEFFRRRYEQFYLISVYASKNERENRLWNNINKIDKSKDNFSKLFEKFDKKDWGTEIKIKEEHKQNVSRCFYLADIAINNNEVIENKDELYKKMLRYFALIAFPGCTQPTREETYMNLAYSLSLRSSCISRQVGAVITDKAGYIVGLGWNDTAHGQIGCGLRQKADLISHSNELFSMDLFKALLDENDLVKYEASDAFCFKDALSEKKIKGKLQKLNLGREIEEKILRDLIIKRLEFCRALHAEENALLQVASRGGMGVDGGVIFTTTFPCELCAKKIYQSGIRKIYFTEPYPDSVSEDVFLKDGIRNIMTIQFEGVKSFSYFTLYKPYIDKKEAQILDD